MNTKLHRGFTLIELMVTIAILAVMLTIAIPDFTSSIQSNNISSTSAKLISSLNYARSEAVKRGTPVSVCATANTNFNACGSNWGQGWIVFVNPSSGTTIANPILRVENNSNFASQITSSPSVNIATYNSSGFAASGTGNVTFTIKATGCTGTSGKSIAISLTGRSSMADVNCP